MTEHRLDDIMIITCENDIAQGKEDSSVGRPTLYADAYQVSFELFVSHFMMSLTAVA